MTSNNPQTDAAGWYVPDLGPMEPLPQSFLETLANMDKACQHADERAMEFALSPNEALDLYIL